MIEQNYDTDPKARNYIRSRSGYWIDMLTCARYPQPFPENTLHRQGSTVSMVTVIVLFAWNS